MRGTGSVAKARTHLVCASMVGSLLSLAPVLFWRDLTLIAACLSFAFFFLELTIGPIWAIPMDIAWTSRMRTRAPRAA